jgi:hypothetical protein
MTITRAASCLAVIGAVLALILLGPERAGLLAQGSAISPKAWEGPNTTPGAADTFRCIFEARWPCQTSTASAPSVDQILARWQQALGGAAALAKINTRVLAQRRFQDVGPPEDHYLMRYTRVRASDRKLSSIMSHTSLDGVFMHWTDGCTPDEAWNWPGRQAKTPSPIEDEAPNCEGRLYFFYGYGYFPLDVNHLKGAYDFEYKGVHKVFQPPAGPVGEMAGGTGPDLVPDYRARDAHMVLTRAKSGTDTAWLYFDTETGVLLRYGNAALPGGEQSFIYAGYVGDVPGKHAAAGFTARTVDFLQYRKVGNGTIMPFQFVTQTPVTRVRGVTVSVVDNAPLPDSVFLKVKNAFRGDRGFGPSGSR